MLLLSIVEIGGYPNFSSLYKSKGLQVETAVGSRKAMKAIKRLQPNIIIAEFNYQSDFRDRLSNLESIIASAQSIKGCKVIVFYEVRHKDHLQRLLDIFDIFATIPFPIEEQQLMDTLDTALQEPN